MRVLVCLAEHAGEVVSIEDLLNHVWSDVTVAPDSVYQAVTSLRRVLGDDPKQPTYIETVPRLGYRMVAPVSPWVDQSNGKLGYLGASDNGIRPRRPTMRLHLAAGAEPDCCGPRALRLASRLSLSFCFTVGWRTTNKQPHPALFHRRRNPSRCCRFWT